MPVLDGFEATLRIRQFEQQLRLPRAHIVGLQAHATSAVPRGVEVGMDRFLHKPLRFQELAAVLPRSPAADVALVPGMAPARRLQMVRGHFSDHF